MAFHPIPQCAKLTIRIQGPQLQVMTVGSYWRLVTPAPFTPLEVKGLADHADTAMLAEGVTAGLVNASCTYLGSEAVALDAPGAAAHFSSANAGPGGVTAQLLPLEIAAVFSFQSGLAGRSHRNRWYWPGVDIGALDSTPRDGLFNATILASWKTTIDAFLAGVAGTEFVHVVGSPKLGTYQDVVGYSIKRRPGSQRRREP
jgi:hypothetical protein